MSLKKILYILVFSTFSLQFLSQVCFELDSTYATGNGFTIDFNGNAGIKQLTGADFNGDGFTDLAIVNSYSNSISVLIGSASGVFTSTINTVISFSLSSIAIADFNNDSKPDLAVTNGSFVTIMIGIGTGSFSPSTSFVAGSSLFGLCSNDFNADGKMDLAVCAGFWSMDTLKVYLGTGLANFALPQKYKIGPQFNAQLYRVISADFNNDGKLDLATGANMSSGFSVLLGTSTGSFGAPTYFNTGSGSGLIAADVNNDGKIDIVSRGTTVFAPVITPKFNIYLGTGTGSFSLPTSFTTNLMPYTVISADYNGDNNLDIAYTYSSNDSISIVLGNGLGGFGAVNSFSVGSITSSIYSTDFNGDGKQDIAVGNFGASSVSILLNNPLSAISSASLICNGNTAILSVSGGATTYTWNTNQTTASIVVSPTINTTYTVTGFGNQCKSTATISLMVSECTGIKNSNTEKTISIYPNPVKDKLYFQTEINSTVSFKITNAMGQLLIQENNFDTSKSIDMSTLLNGIYFLHLDGSDGKMIMKVIKE
jgi:hypothetical protein